MMPTIQNPEVLEAIQHLGTLAHAMPSPSYDLLRAAIPILAMVGGRGDIDRRLIEQTRAAVQQVNMGETLAQLVSGKAVLQQGYDRVFGEADPVQDVLDTAAILVMVITSADSATARFARHQLSFIASQMLQQNSRAWSEWENSMEADPLVGPEWALWKQMEIGGWKHLIFDHPNYTNRQNYLLNENTARHFLHFAKRQVNQHAKIAATTPMPFEALAEIGQTLLITDNAIPASALLCNCWRGMIDGYNHAVLDALTRGRWIDQHGINQEIEASVEQFLRDYDQSLAAEPPAESRDHALDRVAKMCAALPETQCVEILAYTRRLLDQAKEAYQSQKGFGEGAVQAVMGVLRQNGFNGLAAVLKQTIGYRPFGLLE